MLFRVGLIPATVATELVKFMFEADTVKASSPAVRSTAAAWAKLLMLPDIDDCQSGGIGSERQNLHV